MEELNRADDDEAVVRGDASGSGAAVTLAAGLEAAMAGVAAEMARLQLT